MSCKQKMFQGDMTMMEEKVRQIVTDAIDAELPHALGYYHLCWWEDEIQCHPIHHTKKTHPVFLTATGDVLTNGLSPRYWRLLIRRIGCFSGVAETMDQEPALQSVGAADGNSGRRSGGRGKCSSKTRAPVHSPWFRIWTAAGSGRFAGGRHHVGGRGG
jgi:hypothetical protein